MTDIVERLAQWAECDLRATDVAEAAKCEIERLREALEDIATVTRGWEPGVWSEEEGRKYFASLFFGAQRTARAALATQPVKEKNDE